MLDADTKRRINTARDILVGKVPDPKSQVEQITIALIYKFMDDLDAQSEEWGGERTFFAGEFARYGWAKLMAPGLGGYETLNLYAEAIARMAENTDLPPLFRDIFNNAYLPYRDPETLRLFLKVIDEFTYDHSERLGDAFEYLLSVLGAQGDAGQFRTPRHIINFIVKIIGPKKDETVLDPACGTAGFLISAYKHILAANTDEDGQSTLTPDERGRLSDNFKGYDISPDMVRLSLVNMYLHGFPEPHIYEYDTLTNEDRWNEYADVILANPPFMSPRGGIRTHNRFSVESIRSEVLFVDYIAEHLTPNGRAGVIVPEGIIFQSQNAYKKLRKMLVEEYLVAVISLPAGVFQPYSGVKTSILIMDKTLAKKADGIAFFKVENDGYGLGAQRRPIEWNDLPDIERAMREYLNVVSSTSVRETPAPYDSSIQDSPAALYGMPLIVSKDKISENEEYNLSGERYHVPQTRTHDFPVARIKDICTLNPSKREIADWESDIHASFVPMADLNENSMTFQPIKEKLLSEVSSSYRYFADEDVLLARVTPCFENGKAGIARGLTNGIGFGSSEFFVLRCGDQVLPEWMYFCVTHPTFRRVAIAQMTGTGGLQRVPRSCLENFEIPLPTLRVQREIVAEVEGYQKIIDGAWAVIDNYHPHIAVDRDWPIVKLGELSEVIAGLSPPGKSYNDSGKGTPFYQGRTEFGELFIGKPKKWTTDPRRFAEDGDILMSVRAPVGPVNLATQRICIGRGLAAIRSTNHSRLLDRYAFYFLRSIESKITGSAGAVFSSINKRDIEKIGIPLPSLKTQKEIIAEIEAEQSLVSANHKLIQRMENKIEAAISSVWGKDTFVRLDA